MNLKNLTGTTTAGSPVITNVQNIAAATPIGVAIFANGLAKGAYLTGVDLGNNSIQVSQAYPTTGTGVPFYVPDTGWTTVSSGYLQDAGGNLVTGATITFTPVNSSGTPISLRPGVRGVITVAPIRATVTNGVFVAVLLDTANQGVTFGYSVSLIDNLSGRELMGRGYGFIQPTGVQWSLDDCQPVY